MDFSTFSAISELFVSAAVYYVIYTSLMRRPFPKALAFGTALFEFCVNMFYMISRMEAATNPSTLSPGMIVLAAVHGSLSLLVFIVYVVLAFLAYADYRRGRYYFAEHKVQTAIFAFFWLASVVSGEVLYFLKP